MAEQVPSPRGARPSIVESFSIEGLYGYRTISIASEYSATILIAKNGSGKTTILAALDAFLRGQFSRLRDTKFLRIRCKLRAIDQEIILSRDDLIGYFRNEEIELGARRLELEPAILFAFIEEYYADERKLNYEDDIGQRIIQKFGTRAEAQSFCQRLRADLLSNAPTIEAAHTQIRAALSDTEIVYLPTYRRIELSFSPPAHDRLGRRQKPFFPGVKTSLFPADIQFGLSDILERLSDLNQRIVFDSNLGYREISASIINELIDGSFDQVAAMPEDIPDKDELELFFSRLREGGRRRYGPYIDPSSIPNIDKIYTGQDISDERSKFLRYFLAKLSTVIRATRDIEALVRDFIASCNRYLSSIDPSTSLPRDANTPLLAIDEKALRLDRRDLQVSVESLSAGRTIPLDALSSGEKQMISLFAKLFLYPNNKIVLIDEPELSLSLEWQRQILVDVINIPLCSQIVAITHSPFIFDNSLEPFARSLVSSIDPSEGAIPDEAEDDA
ncbi:AAA family ATPase [Bradyrhizobium sp. DASA03120]|uniref:AAA family ATPase n=1 Tax=Bradyrhizobium sp. SMVTL-02 TaxID=3395917 RepID=UPI003F7139B7